MDEASWHLANPHRFEGTGKPVLHLNNAGASPISDSTFDTIVAHLRLERQFGPYEAANRQVESLGAIKTAIGQLLQVAPALVALTDSATRAWNTVIYGLDIKPGDIVLTSQLEFGSTLGSLIDFCQRRGAFVEFAPTDNLGRIDPDALLRALDKRVRLIAIAHAPAHLPLLNPIEEIDRITSEADIPLLVDACQTAGIISLHALSSRRHAICGTGRKWLRGPRGTGFLAVTEAWAAELSPPTVDLANSNVEDLRSDELAPLQFMTDGRRFELWERSIANSLGLGCAVTEAVELGVSTLGEQGIAKAETLKRGLRDDIRARIVCSEMQQTPVVCVRLNIDEAKVAGEHLTHGGVNHSVMSAWDSPIDFDRRGMTKILRLSPHYFTTEETISASTKVINALPSLPG